MQEGRAAIAHDAGTSVIPDSRAVGQRQSKDAGPSQHYQVNGDPGLKWTIVQMCSPYNADVQKPQNNQSSQY